jgi:magnesium transporter
MQAFSASNMDHDFVDLKSFPERFSLREPPASEEEWKERFVVFLTPNELTVANPILRLPDYAVKEATNNVLQHPKLEALEGLLYGVLNRVGEKEGAVFQEEISFFFTTAGILIVSEPSDLIDAVKQSVLMERNEGGRTGSLPERTLFLLVEKIAVSDMNLIRSLDETETILEEKLLAGEKHDYPREIFRLRQKTLVLTQYAGLMVDLLDLLEENQNRLMRPESIGMFRLIGTRLDRVERAATTLRESVAQLREAYQAQVDIDANLMMRLFTVVSVIFLPLTVITGWFGMNFKNMPELSWTYGYPAAAVVSVLVTIGIIWFCKRRKYL